MKSYLAYEYHVCQYHVCQYHVDQMNSPSIYEIMSKMTLPSPLHFWSLLVDPLLPHPIWSLFLAYNIGCLLDSGLVVR